MDTTAKVDIRRLQLLNDRIAQTIEALNQVRLSVHGLGLSHTAGNQGFGLGQVGGNVGLGFGNVHPLQALQGLQGAVPWGQNIGMNPGIQHTSPFGYQQGIPGMVPGLQHTSPFGYQQGIPGLIPGLQQVSPFGYQQQGIPGMVPGLQHTSPFGYQQGIPGLIPGLQQASPFGYPQQGIGGGWQGQNNAWGVPNQGGFGGGLAHTSPELLELQQRQLGLGQGGLGQVNQGGFGVGLDPYTAARILQSFPFAQSAVPGLY